MTPTPTLNTPVLAPAACACPGCRDHPWYDCACCGRPAVVALRDEEFEHSIPLCRACLRVLLECRMPPPKPKPKAKAPKLELEPEPSYEARRSRRRRADDPRRREWDRERRRKQREAERALPIPA